MSEAREESQQLEEENAEQLQELENLELALVQMEKERNISQKRAADLAQLLEEERDRATQEQHQWQGEFKDMRRLLEKQCSLLESRIRDSRDYSEEESDGESRDGSESSTQQVTSRTAELRRRAKSRRAARQQKHKDDSESSQS